MTTTSGNKLKTTDGPGPYVLTCYNCQNVTTIDLILLVSIHNPKEVQVWVRLSQQTSSFNSENIEN